MGTSFNHKTCKTFKKNNEKVTNDFVEFVKIHNNGLNVALYNNSIGAAVFGKVLYIE